MEQDFSKPAGTDVEHLVSQLHRALTSLREAELCFADRPIITGEVMLRVSRNKYRQVKIGTVLVRHRPKCAPRALLRWLLFNGRQTVERFVRRLRGQRTSGRKVAIEQRGSRLCRKRSVCTTTGLKKAYCAISILNCVAYGITSIRERIYNGR